MQVVAADMRYLDAFRDYVDECVADNIAMYEFIFSNYEGFLAKRIDYANGKNLPKGWEPISTYFCVEKGKILGSIRLRHGKSEYINHVIGHIGYETRPSARGQGVARFMLNYLQENTLFESKIVTADSSNLTSRWVIEQCGGTFIEDGYCDEVKVSISRYEISPK